MVQVPDADEQVSALANGVAIGVTVESWGQCVRGQGAADEDRGLGVEPEGLSCKWGGGHEMGNQRKR